MSEPLPQRVPPVPTARLVDVLACGESTSPKRMARMALHRFLNDPNEGRQVLMKVKEHIDFHRVPEHQLQIDARLQNWARWCNGTHAPITSPMFRMVPPPPRVRADSYQSAAAPVDKLDAAEIAKAVAALPKWHRAAINWNYIKPVSPRRACEAIGCGMEELARLVVDGRQMLVNKKA